MKKSLILSLIAAFSITSLLKADLYYDIYNTTNKNIRVGFLPTNEDKRQGIVDLAPGKSRLDYPYYNSTGATGTAGKEVSWGIKQIMIIDHDTGKFMYRDIPKNLQKEPLKITVSYSESIGSKGSEKPMGLWFDYTKKK